MSEQKSTLTSNKKNFKKTNTSLKKKKSFNLNRESNIAAFFFLAPAVIFLSIWFFYPLFESFKISFMDFNYMFKEQATFVGFDNYIRIFKDPEFYQALKHSIIFVIIVVPIQTAISLLLAVLINSEFKGRSFFRTSYYLPYVLSSVAVATVFMYLFTKDTIITQAISMIGVSNTTWFADTKLALLFIAIMYIWQMVGFYMIYYLAGLQSIPSQIYEAAKIDGASKIQTFFHVTVPMLKPTTFLVVTYGIIQAFQLYDQIAVVTSKTGGLGSPAGATSTLLTYFYTNSFKYFDMGFGSSIAIIVFLIILFFTVVQRKLIKLED